MVNFFSKKQKIPKYRCCICNKKTKFSFHLVNNSICYCDNHYCPKHIFPEYHKCTFDYKSKQREELKKNMPVIVADKVPNRI